MLSRLRFLAGASALVVPAVLAAPVRAASASVADLSVVDFGATGDGVTDDLAAIQAAVDACAALGGGNVIFPAGIYMVTGPIRVTADYVNLIGTSPGQPFTFGATQGGSLIKAKGIFTGRDIIQVAQDSPTRCLVGNTVAGLAIHGFAANTANGIYWMVQQGRIQDCFLAGMGCGIYTEGIGYGGTAAPYDCFVDRVKVQTTTGNGLSFFNCSSDFRLTNVVVYHAGGHGVYYDGAATGAAGPGTLMLGCYVYNCAGRAVYAQTPWQTEFVGCRFQECDGGIYLEHSVVGFDGSGFKIVGCTFRDCSATDNGADGVNVNYATPGNGGLIEGCSFYTDAGLSNSAYRRMRYGINLATANVRDVVIGSMAQGHVAGASSTFGTAPVNDLGTGTVMVGALDTGLRLIRKLGNGIIEATGNGSPAGVLAAPKGSTYRRADGGAGTCLYVKESGTGTSGWVAK